MIESRIGTSLRAARGRAGWSREALAFHAGVSLAAIAQIESGRRTDVRLSTLIALADALHVSIDHLVGGTAPVAPTALSHSACFYGSDEEFVASATRFAAEGLERSECVVAVLATRQTDLLRDALGDDAPNVDFKDASDWYRSPSEAVTGYHRFLADCLATGATWVRIIGELVLGGRSEAEVAAWMRYESFINAAFASSPATVMCAYDTTSLPAEVLADAHRTHPEVTQGGEAEANPDYRPPEDFLINHLRFTV